MTRGWERGEEQGWLTCSTMLKQSLTLLKQLGSMGKCQDATDRLEEELVLVEQRVEPAKRAVQVLHKKLQGCLQSQQGLDAEKRAKKLPLMLLSLSMAETLKDFDAADSPFRRVLEMCCCMENRLANILANFEVKLEKEVLEPLNKLSEEDLPEILKNKKQFARLTTDWQNARHKSKASTGHQARQDCLKEDMEEALRRLETIKDQYSADLWHFATKEDEYANYFIRLLELQADYHKESHEFISLRIAELKENHNQTEPQSGQSKVFGEPLLSHLSESGREIAVPIQECVHMLLHSAMTEEGLFRLTAAASVVKRLKGSLDRGTVDHSVFNTEPHAVAGALKCYLRELPEPLMTSELYDDWFKAAGEKELTEKLEQFRAVLRRLPPENYNNLRYLIQFLSCLSERQAVNKMTPRNIAIVLGPNLLWPHAEGEAALLDMASDSSVKVVSVMEPLIQHSRSLFPEAVDFDLPDLPDLPEVPPSLEPTKEGASRTTSSSSTASSSSSSVHPPLSKTSSSASQDSPCTLRSSGSVDRKTTTWESPPSDPPPGPASPSSVQKQNSSPVLGPAQASDPSPAPSPTVAQRPQHFFGTTSVPSPNPAAPVTSLTQKLSPDPGQLQTISEMPPDSPRATLKIVSPFKPRRSFIHKAPAKGLEQMVVAYSKPQAPTSQVPTPPATQTEVPQPQPYPRIKPQAPTRPGAQAGGQQLTTQPPVTPQTPAPLTAQAEVPQPQTPAPLTAQAGGPQPQTPAPLTAQAGGPQPQPHSQLKPQAPPLKKPPPRKPAVRPPKAPPPLPPLVDSKQ